jgi:hypothetical protein
MSPANPKPTPTVRAKLSVYMPADLMRRLQLKALERRVKLSPLVVQLLEQWMRRRK